MEIKKVVESNGKDLVITTNDSSPGSQKSPLPLRSPKPPVTDTAAKSIQALVRGKIVIILHAILLCKLSALHFLSIIFLMSVCFLIPGVVTRRKSMCQDFAMEINSPENSDVKNTKIGDVSPVSPELLSLQAIEEEVKGDVIDGFKNLAPFGTKLSYGASSTPSSSKAQRGKGSTEKIKSGAKLPERSIDRSSMSPSESHIILGQLSKDPALHVDSEMKVTKISSLLKLKISRTMSILCEQLEIAENLENMTAFNSESLNELVEELLTTTAQEATVNSTFENRMRSL